LVATELSRSARGSPHTSVGKIEALKLEMAAALAAAIFYLCV